MTDSPIPMRLCCEGCGKLHIDEGAFATKPHHTHSCQHCGLTWRPAVVPTVGVQFLPGFKNPEPVTKIKVMTGAIGLIEPGQTWQHITSLALLRVKGIGSYVSGGLRIDFTDGGSMEEQALRTHYRRYLTATDKLLHEQTESLFKIDDYVRCRTDGRIGRVAAVNGVGDTEQPNRNRVYVRALEKPVIGWISMWFKPEEIEAWVPKEGERVTLKKNSDVLTVSHVYLREPGDRYALVDGTTYIGAYQRSDFEPAPPPLSILCILDGEHVYVDADAQHSFEWVRSQALAKRKGHGRVAGLPQWEIRDTRGVWIDPALEVKDLESLQGTERPTLYINPPVGSGG